MKNVFVFLTGVVAISFVTIGLVGCSNNTKEKKVETKVETKGANEKKTETQTEEKKTTDNTKK